MKKPFRIIFFTILGLPLIFFDNPRETGKKVYTLDETNFDPNGQLLFLAKDKTFGMDDDHPIAWYGNLKTGRLL
ncbi:MAG: hypothetical protein KTR26_16265 [Flammeovirgaceae bacterium]|nr:hypothetical protein [Flammeovirgaceae bacterium]